MNKTYAKGKVSEIRRTLVYGTPGDLETALENSTCSRTINTSSQISRVSARSGLASATLPVPRPSSLAARFARPASGRLRLI